MDDYLLDKSTKLLERIVDGWSSGHAFGSMSTSIYDTAWLAMIQKQGSNTWLFPECFDHILFHQTPEGAWPCYSSIVDEILNTAAALLALRLHMKASPMNPEWELRSLNAENALKRAFDRWDISKTDQVGFEILISKHISLLSEEGVDLEFKQASHLYELGNAKLERLGPSSLYKIPSTLYHSLEGLIGRIDFDEVKAHREANGSMLGSPSSTAAYLMHASAWDDAAESYLRKALEQSSGRGRGGVPCAWPTTIFETAWVVTTFASVGIPIKAGQKVEIVSMLEEAFHNHKGLVGFSPTALPDVDDTAKAIAALRYLDRPANPDALLHAFETESHFRTYQGERNPSFSSNCNVLISLLILEDPTAYVSQIVKAANFLCKQVINGDVIDKWHLHKLYPIMLLAYSFNLLYERTQNKVLCQQVFSLAPGLAVDIPRIALDITAETVNCQRPDGSWDGICEVTAYGILTLTFLSKLPCIQQLESPWIVDSIEAGKLFLRNNHDKWNEGHYLWIEKVTYASDVLSEAYCIAAAAAPVSSTTPSLSSHPFSSTHRKMHRINKAGALIRRAPLLSQKPHILRVAEFQSCYGLYDLENVRLDIFPRIAMAEDKYLTFIPLIWATCKALESSQVSLAAVRDMMILSMLNYQVDEFMETVVGKHSENNIDRVRELVRKLCSRAGAYPNTEGSQGSNTTFPSSVSEDVLSDIALILGRYTSHILQHPAVLPSPEDLQSRLAIELEIFLQSHITQAQDNLRFIHQNQGRHESQNFDDDTEGVTTQSPAEFSNPARTFYNWVRGTSANHTSCPFSFVFFNCLIASHCGSVFSVPTTAYVAEDFCRHLASLCRMYNDYGSVARDRMEGNLNSVNFPEFQAANDTKHRRDQPLSEQRAKVQLMRIADYERKGLDMTLAHLEGLLEAEGQGDLIGALHLFYHVTDLFGQVYVLKDIASPMK